MSEARVDPAPPGASEQARAIEARLLESRGEITSLYRILLNSPPVCEGWEKLLTAIRQKTSINPRLREMVILRVAVLNRANYEYEAHLPHGRIAGLADEEMTRLKADDFSGFSKLEQLVLDYTDAITRDIRVDPPLFEMIRASFDPVSRVELTATIAAYNMVSRFLVALDVH
jgi:4-carboxymuconolactone decarboxylase